MCFFYNLYDVRSSWLPGIFKLYNLAPIQKSLGTPELQSYCNAGRLGFYMNPHFMAHTVTHKKTKKHCRIFSSRSLPFYASKWMNSKECSFFEPVNISMVTRLHSLVCDRPFTRATTTLITSFDCNKTFFTTSIHLNVRQS